MNESELQRVFEKSIYPKDSRLYSDRGLVDLDKGSMGGTLWICFTIKDNKSIYFDSFGSQLDKFLLKQSSKSIIYHN